jgi:hypothetical protein
VIKCGVCGSENEAAALFCGTCGSPLTPAEAKEIADSAAETAVTPTPEPDEEVFPGKDRGARRDLGTGGLTTVVPDGGPRIAAPPEEVADVETTPGGPTITCGVCGTVNDASRTYCRKCANELKPAPPPPPPPPPPPVRRKISPLALGLGAGAVVVAIALVAVLAMGGGVTPTGTLHPSAQASTPVATSPGVEPTAGQTILPTPTARTFTEGEPSGLIAFARCPSDGSDCSIYLRPADLSEKARRIISASNASALDPAISPDGKRIVYVVEPGLRIVTISNRAVVRHSTGSGDTNPAWSADGMQLTFAGHRDRDHSGDDLEIRIDGLKSSSTSRPLTDNDVTDHDPVFTPDGKSIIFVQGSDDGRELMKLDIGTGEITALTNDAFADEDPVVSPDGTELAYASKRDGEFDLFLMNLTTLEVTPLPKMKGNEHDPDWSPGGRYLVFSADGTNGKDLFILDLTDMTRTAFSVTDGADLTPSWR